jgi:hypothetical protein
MSIDVSSAYVPLGILIERSNEIDCTSANVVMTGK